jgi:SAM-dependent methyltransferase
MEVDFGPTAGDYLQHRTGFPDQLFDRLSDIGIGRPGQRILDLGTGTGSLARGFARRGALVTGIDISEQMLAAARQTTAREGLAVDYHRAAAEATGLPTGAFSVVSAGQCWHWFDRPAAAREAKRLIEPGGRLVIAHFDWVPLPGNVVAATEELIHAFNPSWSFGGGTGIHPAWFRDVRDFEGIESFSFDVDVAYSHEAWRGRIRASSGVGGSLDPHTVEAFDGALRARLIDHFPGDPLAVPHRCFALFATRPLHDR